MSLEDVIIHIRIEEQNRNRDNVEKAKELSSKANVVEEICNIIDTIINIQHK